MTSVRRHTALLLCLLLLALAHGYVLNFDAIEVDGANKMRYTHERSFVKFPGVTHWQPSTLRFEARAVPLPNQFPPQVTVRSNGRDTMQLKLNTKWQSYEIPLDERARSQDTLTVEFRSPTFRPSDVLQGSRDIRNLGFRLASVELRE